jgi:hypothetical protein
MKARFQELIDYDTFMYELIPRTKWIITQCDSVFYLELIINLNRFTKKFSIFSRLLLRTIGNMKILILILSAKAVLPSFELRPLIKVWGWLSKNSRNVYIFSLHM